jgi:hypothetical protein
MNRTIIASLTVLSLLTASCKDEEIGGIKDVAQHKIYQQLDVRHDEGEPSVMVTATLRFSGKNGTTLVLDKPSGITFDGKSVQVDSTKMQGAFYRFNESAGNFSGKHSFVFTDINKKTYSNDFVFDVFDITLPDQASAAQGFSIGYNGPALQGDDFIYLDVRDRDSSESFVLNSKDFKGNSFTLTPAMLKKFKLDALMVDAQRTLYLPLKEATDEGGLITFISDRKPKVITLVKQ